jgi:membrane associated rhomboid family serine protease
MSLTLIIIILTGLISFQAFSNPAIQQQLIFHPHTISRTGQWYRFLSHGLIHANLQHLLINMFVLWQFGEVIELRVFLPLFGDLYGRLLYIFLYFSAIIVASVGTYVKHQNNPGYAAVGASGATSASGVLVHLVRSLAMVYFSSATRYPPWGCLPVLFLLYGKKRQR